jgi:DNA-binding response OmpR family regulator
MERVLIVEDDRALADLMALYLKDAGFEVQIAGTGPEGVRKAAEGWPHLVILDLMLPGLDGWEVCRSIRQTSRVPILMVTARGEEEDRIRGFEEGADDYVVKPFLPRELVARVKAHIRRAQEPPLAHGRERIEYAGFSLNRDGFALHVQGQAVDLTPKEFELLWLMASNPGRAFPRDTLLDRVWGFDTGDARTLEVHISRLREKLGPLKGWIKTVWGVGYKFEAVGA